MEQFNVDDIHWNELEMLARNGELEVENIPSGLVSEYIKGAVERKLVHLTYFITSELSNVLPNETQLIEMFIAASDPESVQFINLVNTYGFNVLSFDDEDCPYRIRKFLGRGTYGQVFQVRSAENTNSKSLAIKIIDDPDMISIIEIDLLTRLRHPALIHRESELLTGICGLDQGIAFTMPLAQYNLYTLPPISMKLAIQYFYTTLSGVKFLHDHNIIHLDVSPYNILILDDDKIVLSDFGLSVQTHTGLYKTNALKYTEGYRPIMDSQTGVYGTYSDIWALGATMYELFTANIPNSTDQTVLNLQLSQVYEPVRPVLERMLVIDPQNRATAEELLQMELFDTFSKLEGYIIPPPQINPSVFEDPGLLTGLNSISELEQDDVKNLARDLFARLLSLFPDDEVYILVDVAINIASGYYQHGFDRVDGLSAYLSKLDGYIYRGSDMLL